MEANNEGRSLEETAERLRRAQKAGRIGTWDWDIGTNQLIWDGVEAVHGLPEGTFVGTFESYLKDIHPDDKPRVLAAISDAVESGSDLDIEYRVILPDGSERWVEGRGTCFKNEAGVTVRMTGTCQDITARRQADEDKEVLLSFAAHELRSPLSTVMGYSKLIEASIAKDPDRFDQMTREGIAAIVEESKRMADVINYFLDLARAETRPSHLDVENVDLKELLAREVERVALEAPEATIEAHLPDEPVPVQTEVRRVEQIVSNLLANAVKYGGSPPVVQLTCTLAPGEIVITVKDNGPGIPEEQRAHIFQRFFRGANASEKGLGIGLYLSRQFAEQLGGGLELLDGEGGAAFRLTLPRDGA